MGSNVGVVFAEPLPEGTVFEREAWPLHATVLRFDTPHGSEESELLRRIGRALAGRPASIAAVGQDAGFGRDGSIPVSLVEAGSGLPELHTAVLDELEGWAQLPGRHHTRAGYRPHVTHTVGRLWPGDRFSVDHAALVDMRPGGDHRFRRVVAVWPLGAGADAAGGPADATGGPTAP